MKALSFFKKYKKYNYNRKVIFEILDSSVSLQQSKFLPNFLSPGSQINTDDFQGHTEEKPLKTS